MTRESAIEQYLVERVRALGGEVRKVRWVGHNGAPDRLVMLPGRIVWVELKAPGKRCRPRQIREHARMRGMGQRVEVVDSFERVDEVLAKQQQQQQQQQKPVARVVALTVAGSRDVDTKIVEIYDLDREPLQPGEVLYAAPLAEGV